MPRMSVRKVFMYFLAAASFVLVMINVQQSVVGRFNAGSNPSGPSGPPGSAVSGPGAGGDEDLPDAPPKSEEGGGGGGKGAERHNRDDGDNDGGGDDDDVEIRRLAKEMAPVQRLPRRRFDLSPLPSDDLRVATDPEELPWYIKGGAMQPKQCEIDLKSGKRMATVFPDESLGNDRIPDQLMYVPPKGFVPDNPEDPSTPLKKILLWNGISSWGGHRAGRGVFLKERCPVNSCVLSSSRTDASEADLVLFKDHFTMPTFKRPKKQLWMMYMLECPLHTPLFKVKNVFNWTATYRSDSTIVAPYERWQYYNENVRFKEQEKNYAANKTKAVAWFVSNCGARNGRLSYAKELQKYIQVDIYGSCGTKRCPRSQATACFDMLDRTYKFYLAFENSNCKDYITEKFYVNGLGHDVIPIVMGARPQDYERSAPFHSFIHVDDFDGPEDLAKYLHVLDQDDQLYNEYFQWKGTGQFINTKFFCRVCALLHDPKVSNKGGDLSSDAQYYEDINKWWRGPGTCINGSWRKFSQALKAKENKRVPKVTDTPAEQEDKEAKLP